MLSRKLLRQTRKLNLNPRRAILGDQNGVIDEPGRTGYVRVRYPASPENSNSLAYPTTIRMNAIVPKKRNQKVLVGYDDDGEIAVIKADFSGTLAGGENPIVNNPADQEVFRYVDQRNITTLRSQAVGPGAPMWVSVLGWPYVDSAGVYHEFIGEQINLTSSIPGTANHVRLALVALKTDDTLEIKTSTSQDQSNPLDSTDIQECIDSLTDGSTPVHLYKLVNGMTDILDEHDYMDMRQFINVGFPGAGGGSIAPQFSANTTQTVANTTTETTLFGSGTGTLTIPANRLEVGSVIVCDLAGVYSTKGSPVGNVTFRAKLGGTNVCVTATSSFFAANITNNSWHLWLLITCQSTGVSGGIIGQAMLGYSTGTVNGEFVQLPGSLTPITIDTTGTLALNVTFEWATADNSNSISCTSALVNIWPLQGSAGGAGGGSGTVTSVALSASPSGIFDVSGSPIVGSGTLALSMDNQSANQVLAGPSSGGAATPAFRALVLDDIPVAARPWQTTSNVVNLVTAGDNVNVGGTAALAKLAVDGDADEVQLRIQGNGTQTALLAVFEDSAGNHQVTISGDGAVVINEEGNDADVRIESDADANNFFSDGGNNNVGFGTGTPDASAKLHVVSTAKGAISRPVMTAAQAAAIGSPAEGLQVYESDTEHDNVYDAQRFRGISARGWCPYAYPINFVASAAFTTNLVLAANGGSIAIPIAVVGHLLLESVSVRNLDVSTARTWGWDLYEQFLNNGNGGENTLTRVVASNGNETFTPGAASTRTLAASGAPVYLAPGTYWLVVQCRHASNNFVLGSTAASAAFALNSAQTKTTTNPNGSTLDFVAATWTKVTAIYAVRLNGRVFGETTVF